MPITFVVSDVPRAEQAPAQVHFTSARERLGGRAIVAAGGPESVLDGPAIPALVHAAHVAFAEHRPLVLAPDDVWFAVLQGVAAHVTLHAEELRPRLLPFEGTRAIEIRRDDLAPAADPPGDWSTVPGEIATEALALAGPTARALRVELSTTDRHARVAMDVALLDALQSYFSYSVSSLCGIPSVTLLGEPGDWATLVERAGALAGLGLDAWLGPLREVLVEMHRAASGAVDRDFWRALYKPEHFSGGDLVVGWINVLFPYARDGRELREVERFLPRNLPGGPDLEASWMPDGGAMPLKPSEFPSSLARAPFTWKLAHSTHAMDLVAGHVGAGFDAATGAVSPRFGWWVAPRTAPRAFLVHNPSPAGCLLLPRDPALRDLATVAAEAEGYAAVDLSLSWCKELESLEGVEALRALSRLTMLECNRLTTLAPLAGLPALRELHVSQCSEMEDLSALASLESLESVVVMRCPKARGIEAIARLPRLRQATLWGFPGLPERFQKNLTDAADVRALQEWLREHPSA
jgi:hypothetical protein